MSYRQGFDSNTELGTLALNVVVNDGGSCHKHEQYHTDQCRTTNVRAINAKRHQSTVRQRNATTPITGPLTGGRGSTPHAPGSPGPGTNTNLPHDNDHDDNDNDDSDTDNDLNHALRYVSRLQPPVPLRQHGKSRSSVRRLPTAGQQQSNAPTVCERWRSVCSLPRGRQTRM